MGRAAKYGKRQQYTMDDVHLHGYYFATNGTLSEAGAHTGRANPAFRLGS